MIILVSLEVILQFVNYSKTTKHDVIITFFFSASILFCFVTVSPLLLPQPPEYWSFRLRLQQVVLSVVIVFIL